MRLKRARVGRSIVGGTRLKERVKRPLYTGAVAVVRKSGLTSLRDLPNRPGTLRVLTYHKVNNLTPNSLTVSTRSFRQQQLFLQEHFTVVSLQDVADHIGGRRSLLPRATLITFDDGYRDNYTNAYPILKSLGHAAVIFVPTDFVGAKTLPHDENQSASNPTLDWEQLSEMSDVFEIGSHGRSHRSLARIPLSLARAEIVESKRILESKLGVRIRAFAYPFGSIGDFNDDLETCIRYDAGYDMAFTQLPRTNRGEINPFSITRYNVEDYGVDYFAALLDGSADILGVKDTRVGYLIKHSLTSQELA